MFRKLNGTLYTFFKRNSKGLVITISTAIGLKECLNNDLFKIEAVHAFSLFPAKIDLSDVLTEPVSGEKTIMENKDKMKYKMEAFITNLQGKIIKKLQELEKDAKFKVDKWSRAEGGGGITCIVEDGSTFERAAVNISVVNGVLPAAAVAQMRSRGKKTLPEGKALNFTACGISSVIHPRNPYVPTLHFNYRYFEVEIEPGKYEWWFGGGTDLTPYYLDEDDVKHFHKSLKSACDKHDSSHYPNFKKWCDKYFYIEHRNECRGVGGIFFDDLDTPNQDKVFEFVKSCGNSILPGYVPIVEKNVKRGYGLDERNWQLLRRGRYVEFNLVYDRGTKFGLLTPGSRIESILVSLPMTARWSYKHEPREGSEEHKLWKVLKTPKDWI